MSGRVPFDPKSLITTVDELRNLSVDFARRRVAFTESWLAQAGLVATITDVQGRGAASWTNTGVDPKAIAALKRAGFTEKQLHLVFIHPDAMAGNPRVLVYYRRLLSMSHKVFARLFPKLTAREGRPDGTPLTQRHALASFEAGGPFPRRTNPPRYPV